MHHTCVCDMPDACVVGGTFLFIIPFTIFFKRIINIAWCLTMTTWFFHVASINSDTHIFVRNQSLGSDDQREWKWGGCGDPPVQKGKGKSEGFNKMHASTLKFEESISVSKVPTRVACGEGEIVQTR